MRPAFINEHQTPRIKPPDRLEPMQTGVLVALYGLNRLFFKVIESRLNARCIVETLTCTPVCSVQSWQ